MAGRQCARCGVDIAHRDLRSKHCSPLCRDRDYENSVIGTTRGCRHCGGEFSPSRNAHVFCTPTCRAQSDLINNRAAYNRRNAERRARLRAAPVVEQFTRREILDRDGWICQLCLAPIDWSLSGRGRFAPAIDHIIPLSKGGSHSRDNVWAAHSGCNARKQDREVFLLPVPGRA